jgi:hypothetical protein
MPEIISGFKVGGEGLDAAPFGKIGGVSEWQTDQAERSDDDDDRTLATWHGSKIHNRENI